MKLAVRIVGTLVAAALLLAALPLTYGGLALLIAQGLSLGGAASPWPLLAVFGGPIALFVSMLILYRLYPAHFR